MSEFKEYLRYDGLGLADLVRRGEVSASDLVETAIARIERGNPALNAVIHTMYDSARATARGVNRGAAAPFAGVPFLVKDLVSTWAGEKQRNGSRLLESWVAPRDSEMARRYRGAGLIPVGKTNTPEFGLLPFTEPALFGPTRNPWNTDRTPGGSSGGSGASVAAGFVPLAGGGDGGGSIRIPSSCCGLFGLKPTRGRTPLGPDAGEAWQGCALEHVLTRSVRDSAAVLDAVSGGDPGAPYAAPPAPARPFLDEVGAPTGKLRVAFTTRALLPATVHPDCVAATEAAARLLGELGHEVVEDAPPLDGAQFAVDFTHMLVGEVYADVKEFEQLAGRAVAAGDLELTTELLMRLGAAVGAGDFALSMRRLKRVARQQAEWFSRFDVLLTPTLALPPVGIGELLPRGGEKVLMLAATKLRAGRLFHKLGALAQIAANAWNFIPFTAVWNATGQPACSVPIHQSADGLPIGVQLVGRFGDEATLFRLASQMEAARPWFDRRPPRFAD